MYLDQSTEALLHCFVVPVTFHPSGCPVTNVTAKNVHL